jgi:hypothetical protein
MGPYTHLLVANRLAADLSPTDLPAYYWGAVAPDTRYLVPGMHRSQTHITPERLLNYAQRYPRLQDFILGYWVHLATDWIDLPGFLQRSFPFCFCKNKLPTHTASTLVEFYTLQRPFKTPPPISGEHNPVLFDVGIPAETAHIFAHNLAAYLAHPSYRAVLAIFMVPGIQTNPRVAQYQAAAQRFERAWFLKRLVFWGLQTSHIHSKIILGVKTIMAQEPASRFLAPRSVVEFVNPPK